MRYVYSVVRFVPDPARGESVNLAVIAGSDESSEWELRRVDSLKRARALDDRRILPGAVGYLERLAGEIEDYVTAIDEDRHPRSALSEIWLRSLAIHCQNAIQLTEPAPLLANSLESAIGMAADEFLAPPELLIEAAESGTMGTSVRKHAVLAATRQAFRAQGLRKGEHYAERVEIVAGQHGREAFDFLVYNGRALQLVQAWSFRTMVQEDLSRRLRAWAWVLEGLRRAGGSAVAGSRNLEIDPSVAVRAIYVAPSSDEPHPVWEEADTAFRELSVIAFPVDKAGELAVEAARLIGHQHAS